MTPVKNCSLGGLLGASLVAGLTGGCGPQCALIQADRDAFLSLAVQGAPHSRGSHLRIAVPTRILTRGLDASLAKMKPASFDLPGLGDLGRFLPTKLGLKARKIQLSLDKGDAARVTLDFDVVRGNKPIFGLEMAAATPVTYSPTKGKLRFSIRADMFEKVRPRLDAKAAEDLADDLYDLIPSAAHFLVGRDDVRRVARGAVDWLADHAYELLREQVLSKVGELTSFSVRIPDVPIAGLSLTSVGGMNGFLRLDARLDLPVDVGLPDNDPEMQAALEEILKGRATEETDTVEVAVATQAVMAMANWAIAKGKLPDRYTDEGVPSPEGSFQIGAGWTPGARPLKVHLWNLSSPAMCLHAVAAGDASVSWKRGDPGAPKVGGKAPVKAEGELEVTVKNSKIEELTGPPLLQMVLDVTNIGEGIFDFTKKISTQSELGVGGDTWRLGVSSVKLDGQIFRLRMLAKAQ